MSQQSAWRGTQSISRWQDMPEAVFVVPGAAAASWWSTITAMCPCILWIAFALVLLVLRSVTAHTVDSTLT
jgi:hypothetical protein